MEENILKGRLTRNFSPDFKLFRCTMEGACVNGMSTKLSLPQTGLGGSFLGNAYYAKHIKIKPLLENYHLAVGL